MSMVSRRSLLKGFAALALTLLAGGAYASVVEPRFRLVRQVWRPKVAAWPADLPLRLAILADIHMGPPAMTPARLQTIVAETMALEPDVILLLGDYVASHRFVSHRVPPKETAAVLGQLRAPLGVWAILGNHDWWDDPAAQQRRSGPAHWQGVLEDAGIPVLENRAERLVWRDRPFWIIGIGSQIAFRNPPAGADDLDAALADVREDDAPAILLAHEPDIFPRVPSRVALTLSGHTHGGQVRVLGYSPVVPSRFGNRYAYGHVVEEGRHLVVSGGLGCSIAPVRFGVPPEITMVELGGEA
jgi:uncharacterized protein